MTVMMHFLTCSHTKVVY